MSSSCGGGNDGGENDNGIDCDSSCPDFCIPSPPPDLDCGDVDGSNFTVRGNDPHGFDADNDGIGCEDDSGLDEPVQEPVECEEGLTYNRETGQYEHMIHLFECDGVILYQEECPEQDEDESIDDDEHEQEEPEEPDDEDVVNDDDDEENDVDDGDENQDEEVNEDQA